SLLSEGLNYDFASKGIDEPLTTEELQGMQGILGIRDGVLKTSGKTNPSARDFVTFSGRGQTQDAIVGGPKEIADRLEEMFVGRDPFGEWQRTPRSHPLADVKIELPVMPRTFYCVGLNYLKHLKEAADKRGEVPNVPDRPEIGYRAQNALIAHDEDVVIPATATEKIHYEGELVVVIGQKAKHLTEADAMSCVFGYTIGNDVSERTWQKADRGLWRAKN